jgi:hypothetical protein|tara:strand:- start:2524 stop:2937 length:414 start_codon:yes stop_codon:yes gene_type:complete
VAKKVNEIIKILLYQVLFTLLALIILSCEDKYLTIENRVIDAENNIPIYFQATAEQDGLNTWRPVFTYYIYHMNEGVHDAYFHAYIMMNDSIIFSGVQPISIEGGKTIWGEYIAVGANFSPELIVNSTPMAYVSVSY